MTLRKKKGIAIGSILLVAVIVIGASMAYLTQRTEERVNNFTFAGADGLDARLVEPEWDGVVDYEYDDAGELTPVYGYTPEGKPIYGYEDGNISKPVTDKGDIDNTTKRPNKPEGYGDENAQEMIPGQEAKKNPIIYNTGVQCDIWVAAKITFVYGYGSPKAGQPLSATDMLKVTDAITIDYNTDTADNWELISTDATGIAKVFYYKETLDRIADGAAAGVYDKTDPIFTTVKVKTSATTAEVKALEDMGGFAIYIEGFAAQSSVVDLPGTPTAAEKYAAWKAWANDNVTFRNTPTDSDPMDVTPPGIIKKEMD